MGTRPNLSEAVWSSQALEMWSTEYLSASGQKREYVCFPFSYKNFSSLNDSFQNHSQKTPSASAMDQMLTSPQNSYAETLIHNEMVLRDGTSWWDYWPYTKRQRKRTHSLSLPCVDIARRWLPESQEESPHQKLIMLVPCSQISRVQVCGK